MRRRSFNPDDIEKHAEEWAEIAETATRHEAEIMRDILEEQNSVFSDQELLENATSASHTRIDRAERRIGCLTFLSVSSLLLTIALLFGMFPNLATMGQRLIQGASLEEVVSKAAEVIPAVNVDTKKPKPKTGTVSITPENVPVYNGPPFREVPDGQLIESVWEPILAGVQKEGGTPEDALKLYWVQRSECKDPNGQCVSSVGAEGWFQFMPATWGDYAEPGWSPYNLEEAARAAYRKQKADKLLEQVTKEEYQGRFTGHDNDKAVSIWNYGQPGSPQYDGWDQAGWVWDQIQSTKDLIKKDAVEDLPSTGQVQICYPTDPAAVLGPSFGVTLWYGQHFGQDFWLFNEWGKRDTVPAFALTSGSVTISYDKTVDGIVELRPDNLDDIVIKYYHMREKTIEDLPSHVSCGDPLGFADGGGETSKDIHLHVQVEVKGVPVNPITWMEQYKGFPEPEPEPDPIPEPEPVPNPYPAPGDPPKEEELPGTLNVRVPKGYKLSIQGNGVVLYNRGNVYAQVIDLSTGASIEIMPKNGGPSFHNPGGASAGNAFCATTGSFHKLGEVNMNYPVKAFNWQVDGWDDRGDRELRLLSLWGDHATVTIYQLGDPITAPQGIVGENPLGKREKNRSTGRNYIGVFDSDDDGIIESVLIVVMTDGFTEQAAKRELESWGISEANMIMLDGGNSTRINCKGADLSVYDTVVAVSLATYEAK